MSALIFFISIALSIAYVYLLMWITDGWEAVGSYQINENPTTKVSVVIAARNEASYIERCLKSIIDNDYPSQLIEIIVVDDQSTDDTASIIQSQFPQVKLLQTSDQQSGKKAAIKLAAIAATGDVLLFTDADSYVPTRWISTMLSNYEEGKIDFLAAPVKIDLEDTALSRFQFLDVVATMAVTANGIHRKSYYAANGANMLVNRSKFLELYKQRKDEDLASGDDMFVIQQLALESPDRIAYVKLIDATVTTPGMLTIAGFLSQRKRWAAKSKHYPEKGILYIQVFVFGLVALMIFNVIYGLMTNGFGVFVAALMLFIKMVIDYLFLNQLSDFFGEKEGMKKYLISGFAYNAYILFAAAMAIVPMKYMWKGRTVN